jgi:DNA-binding response OmpR family regulator
MTPPPLRLIVVCDDHVPRGALVSILRNAGYQVLSKSCIQACRTILSQSFDLLVLRVSGLTPAAERLFKTIQETPRTQNLPILLLSGDQAGLDSVPLISGGQRSLFNPKALGRGLIAQIRAMMGRRAVVTSEAVIQQGDLRVETGPRHVYWRGRRIEPLTPKEFELLKNVVLHAPAVVERKELIKGAWGVPLRLLHVRSLDVHIRRIRLKLGPQAAACLITVPAVGYQWLQRAPTRKPTKPASVAPD